MRSSVVLVLGLALLVAGCTPLPSSLLVQLRSDYLPGVDVDLAVVRLRLADRDVGTPVETPITVGDALGRGVRLAALGDLTSGTYDVDLELLRRGVVVTRTSRIVRVSGTTVATFLVTRDCELRADCGGDICIAGECAPPTCIEEQPEECPVVCSATSACVPSTVACVDTQCTVGVCFAAPDATRCDAGELCDATLGCITPPVDGSAPIVFFPWNGYATGSFRASSAALESPPLRPRVVWTPVADARDYLVQLTSECDRVTFATCAFATPTVSERTTATEWRATSDLPVSVTPPVGRRYYVRVGACADASDASCVFGVPHYVDVGRARNNVDRDGFGDVVLLTSVESGGAPLYLLVALHGEAAGGLERPETATLGSVDEVDATGVPVRMAILGDLYGEDVTMWGAFVTWNNAGTLEGSLRTVHGAAQDGNASDELRAWPEAGIAYAGDLDADGASDLLSFGQGDLLAERYVSVRYAPLARLASGDPMFAMEAGGGCDVDADGAIDVVAVGRGTSAPYASIVHREGTMLVALAPSSSAAAGPVTAPRIAPGRDLDGDGRCEVPVGIGEFATLLVLGAGGGVTVSSGGLQDSLGRYCDTVATGDPDGDGRGRIACGVPLRRSTDGALAEVGMVHEITYDEATGAYVISLALEGMVAGERLGTAVTYADLDGDGRDELIAATETTNKLVVRSASGTARVSASVLDTILTAPDVVVRLAVDLAP